MPQLIETHTVGLDCARIGVGAAVEKATALGCRACVAILDLGGHLVAFERMDGAPFQSIDHAIDKAISVAGNGNATHEMWDYVQDSPWLIAGIGKVRGLSILGGGVPIVLDGMQVGSVGVSGSCGMTEDRAIAEAAVAAVIAAVAEAASRPTAEQ